MGLIKKVLFGAGFVGSLLVSSCEVVDQIAKNPNAQSLAIGALATGINTAVTEEVQSNYPQNRSRTDINVTNNYGDPSRTTNYVDPVTGRSVSSWVPLPKSFVCRNIVDRNLDGYFGGDELIGKSNYFDFTEDPAFVLVGASWDDALGKEVTSKVFDIGEGKIISVENIAPPSRATSFVTFDGVNHEDFSRSNTIGLKEYRVEWYLEGRLDPNRTINFFVDWGRK